MRKVTRVNVINNTTGIIEVKVVWNAGKDHKTEKLYQATVLSVDFKTWKIPGLSKVEITIADRSDLNTFEYIYEVDSKEIWDERIENYNPPPPPPPPPDEFGHHGNARQLTISNNSPSRQHFYIKWNEGKNQKDFNAWEMTNTVIFPEQYDIRHNSKIEIYIEAPHKPKHFSFTYDSGTGRSIMAEIRMDSNLSISDR